MVALTVILTVLHVFISFGLVIVILMQSSKGGGLSGTFGGQAAGSFFGQRGTANALTSITKYLGAGFMVLSLALSLLAGAGGKVESVTQKVLDAAPSLNLPAVEDMSFDPTGATQTPAPTEDATE